MKYVAIYRRSNNAYAPVTIFKGRQNPPSSERICLSRI